MKQHLLRALAIAALAAGALLVPATAGAAAPANDDFANAVVISSLPFTDAEDSSEATSALDDPAACHNSGSVWYAFTPAQDTMVVADTIGSGYDTTLSAYTGSEGSLSLVPGACNDDFFGLQSRVSFSATAGTTYYFLVGICCGLGGTGGGNLVFNVDEVAPPPPPPPPPTSGTFLYLTSEPGDFIGGGQTRTFMPADSSISGNVSPNRSEFHASVFPFAGGFWFVDLAVPSGQELVPGAYEGAVRWPFQPPNLPGLSVSGDGRGCNTLTGRFDVEEVEYAPTGELLVFDAAFEQHCEGNPAALFGEIRIENPPPPPDTTPPTLFLPADITVEAPDGNGAVVSYSAVATDDRDPNPLVSCDPASGTLFPIGTTTVNCTATDASENVASGSFLVNVLAPLVFDLRVDSTGSVNAKTGVVTVRGKVVCSRALLVDVTGELRQRVGRATIAASFAVQVNCSAPETAWSVDVTSPNGLFVGGRAQVTAQASGCELSCHSDSEASSVRLRG